MYHRILLGVEQNGLAADVIPYLAKGATGSPSCLAFICTPNALQLPCSKSRRVWFATVLPLRQRAAEGVPVFLPLPRVQQNRCVMDGRDAARPSFQTICQELTSATRLPADCNTIRRPERDRCCCKRVDAALRETRPPAPLRRPAFLFFGHHWAATFADAASGSAAGVAPFSMGISGGGAPVPPMFPGPLGRAPTQA